MSQPNYSSFFYKEKLKKMSKITNKITTPEYLFIHSGVLEKSQIEKCINDVILFLSENFDHTLKNTQVEINVVKNKEGKKYGHTYCWISNEKVSNALIGYNFDGSERFSLVPDEDWEPPEEDYDDAYEQADGDWAEMTAVDFSYTRPNKKIPLEPLVTLPAVKYTPEQLKEVENESEFGFLEIFPIKISEKIGKLNSIFSDNIPSWVTEEMIFNRFKKFNKDSTVYSEKKSRKKFVYPIVKIKRKNDSRGCRNFCTITFSPIYRHTASFLINLVKRIILKEGEKEAMLFFSQSKSKNN